MAFPIPLWRFAKSYADRVFTDHSRLLGKNLRAFWHRGEQLWDAEMNQNMGWWEALVARVTNYRKYQNIVTVPPIYSPYITTFIYDPAHRNVSGPPTNTIYFFARGMQEAIHYGYLPGLKCYVKADRNVVIYTDSGWRPITKHDYAMENVEIAVFASIGAVKKNSILCSTEITRTINFWRSGKRSRARDLSYNYPGLQLRKNGVKVGVIYVAQHGSGLRMDADVTFHPGDILSVYVDEFVRWSEPLSFSIVGSIGDFS
jgi:hypothetical protein